MLTITCLQAPSSPTLRTTAGDPSQRDRKNLLENSLSVYACFLFKHTELEVLVPMPARVSAHGWAFSNGAITCGSMKWDNPYPSLLYCIWEDPTMEHLVDDPAELAPYQSPPVAGNLCES
jgi:hypothetical protein